MKLPRRNLLHLAAGAAALPVLPRFALAQARRDPIAIEEATIADLEAAYISGRATARAVTQAHLDRIEAYDKRGPFINSLITVNPRALEEADLRTTHWWGCGRRSASCRRPE
jgi:amidase